MAICPLGLWENMGAGEGQTNVSMFDVTALAQSLVNNEEPHKTTASDVAC